MAKKLSKTNAMRLLDKAGIPYDIIAYDCDGRNFDGESVALQVGLPGDQVFKTLVTRSDGGEILVCCIPVNRHLDMKALALAAGCKRVEMAKTDELLALTGYIRGGCSPLGMKRRHRTFLHSSALDAGKIAVSAGVRGMQLYLSSADLADQTGARTGNFVRDG